MLQRSSQLTLIRVVLTVVVMVLLALAVVSTLEAPPSAVPSGSATEPEEHTATTLEAGDEERGAEHQRAAESPPSERRDETLPTPADDEVAEDDEPRLRGRVLTSRGQPVASAIVYLAWRTSAAVGVIDAELTGDDGRFEIRALKWSGRRRPEASSAYLRILEPQHGLATVELEDSVFTEGRDVGDLLLEDGAVLAGVVLDETGPVAGLEIDATPRDSVPGLPPVWSTDQTTVTDVNGRFAFRGLFPVVHALQSSGSADFGDFAPDREDLVLWLEGGAAWTVRVFDDEGLRRDVRPQVQKVEPRPGGGWQPPGSSLVDHTMGQAEDGSWSIAFRAPGPRAISATVEDERLRAEAIIEVASGARGQLDLRLTEAAEVDLSSLRTLDPDHAEILCDRRAWDPLTGASAGTTRGTYRMPATFVLRPLPPSLALPQAFSLPDELPGQEWISPGWGGRVRLTFDPPRSGRMVRVTLGEEEAFWISAGSNFAGRFAKQDKVNHSHPALPAGDYVLRAELRGHAVQEIPVTLVEGRLTELALRFP